MHNITCLRLPHRTVRINFEIGYAGIDLSANLIRDIAMCRTLHAELQDSLNPNVNWLEHTSAAPRYEYHNDAGVLFLRPTQEDFGFVN
jgi:hypothetical protein